MTKRMKKLIIYFLIILLLPVFGACKPLKDGYGLDNPEQYSRIYLAAAYNGDLSLEITASTPAQLKVFANYSGVVPLKSDVTVSLGGDLSLVEPYNSENGTAFAALPNDCFRMDQAGSIIRAGESTAAEPALISIVSSAFPDDNTYLLPVRIKSVSDPSLTVNPNLEAVYFSIRCTAGTTYISTNPLSDYSVSDTENW